jgi:hypothetical protein
MEGESTAVMHEQTSYLKQKQIACINKSANHNTMRGSMSQYSPAKMVKRKRTIFYVFYARIHFKIFNCSLAVVNHKGGKVLAER